MTRQRALEQLQVLQYRGRLGASPPTCHTTFPKIPKLALGQQAETTACFSEDHVRLYHENEPRTFRDIRFFPNQASSLRLPHASEDMAPSVSHGISPSTFWGDAAKTMRVAPTRMLF